MCKPTLSLNLRLFLKDYESLHNSFVIVFGPKHSLLVGMFSTHCPRLSLSEQSAVISNIVSMCQMYQ